MPEYFYRLFQRYNEETAQNNYKTKQYETVKDSYPDYEPRQPGR